MLLPVPRLPISLPPPPSQVVKTNTLLTKPVVVVKCPLLPPQAMSPNPTPSPLALPMPKPLPSQDQEVPESPSFQVL
jgi:hypothetical protein